MGLRRNLNLLDATAIGVGAIIGAGIFVVLGLALGYAGPSVVVSIVIAGVVASFTAFSFAELGSAIPKEGGAYEYALELISPSVGFVVGCLWVSAQVVAGAAISLGFAGYFVSVFPGVSLKMVAVIIALMLTGLNLVGAKQSTIVNNVLVFIKVAVLALFIGFGLLQMNLQRFSDFSPSGPVGILQGAGFIFFAYLGYGRVATLAEEVKNPERNLPLAILIALAVSVVVYVLTALAAAGLQDYRVLAQSSSPIAEAAATTGNFTLVAAVSFGALIATASVLLTNLLGVSRVAFAMARNGQLPKSAAKVSARFGTPYVSIIASGVLLTVLTYFLDLRQAAAITSFSLLCVHLTVNFCAFRLGKTMRTSGRFKMPCYPAIPVLGLFSCLVLMFSLPLESWIVTVAIVAVSAILYLLGNKRPENFGH